MSSPTPLPDTPLKGCQYAIMAACFVIGAVVAGLMLCANNIPAMAYLPEAAVIFVAAGAVGALLYLGFGRTSVRLDIAAAIAAALTAYVVESSLRLESKENLRKAVVADISSILSILDQIDIIRYIEIISNPNAQVRAKKPVSVDDPKCTRVSTENRDVKLVVERNLKIPLLWDISFDELQSISDERIVQRKREELKYKLEKTTQFMSGEDYFKFWDQIVKEIGNLSEDSIESVASFYSMLRGSRDVFRGFQVISAHVFDKNTNDLKLTVLRLNANELSVLYSVICFGNNALRKLKAPSDRFLSLQNAALDAAYEGLATYNQGLKQRDLP